MQKGQQDYAQRNLAVPAAAAAVLAVLIASVVAVAVAILTTKTHLACLK